MGKVICLITKKEINVEEIRKNLELYKRIQNLQHSIARMNSVLKELEKAPKKQLD